MNPLHTFWGKVKKGKGRGRLLGFPTANILLHHRIPEGVYASQSTTSGHTYISATFVGSAKTFGEHEYKAESYLLDFKKNIYGKWITITLFKKLRGNKKFASPQALVTQMKRDVLETGRFFHQRPGHVVDSK